MATNKTLHISSASTMAVLNGTDDVANWDDEELLRGRRRGKGGTFSGKAPTSVVPAAIHHELTRRRLKRAQEVLQSNLVVAIELWASVVKDADETMAFRLKASELIVERVMGKATQLMNVDMRVEHSTWEEAMKGVVIKVVGGQPPAEPDDIVDAEVVEVIKEEPLPKEPGEGWKRHHKDWQEQDNKAAVGDVFEWDEDEDPIL